MDSLPEPSPVESASESVFRSSFVNYYRDPSLSMGNMSTGVCRARPGCTTLKITAMRLRLVILGTDFDRGPTLPLPMHDISDVPLIIGAMRRRDYSGERIQKIMGGNLLHVFQQITNK
jgi:Membrane dipeptidase (Peptidase family M19)